MCYCVPWVHLIVHFIFLPLVLLPLLWFFPQVLWKWIINHLSCFWIQIFFCSGRTMGSDSWPVIIWKYHVAFIEGYYWEISVAVSFRYWVSKQKNIIFALKCKSSVPSLPCSKLTLPCGAELTWVGSENAPTVCTTNPPSAGPYLCVRDLSSWTTSLQKVALLCWRKAGSTVDVSVHAEDRKV